MLTFYGKAQNNMTPKQTVKNKVKELLKLGNTLFPHAQIDYNELTIKFSLWGSTTLGKASYSQRTLWFHPKMMERDINAYIKDTVAHEVAHLYQKKMYPRSSSHGWEFKYVARKLGDSGDRCSKLDTSGLGRTKTRYIYKCPLCGKEYKLTKYKHDKQQQRVKTPYGYTCGVCNKKLEYSGKVIQFK